VIRNRKKWLLSLSPELFFRLEDDRICSKPMKGTLKRGRTTDKDCEFARFLANDSKNRAENIMIVDLLWRISTIAFRKFSAKLEKPDSKHLHHEPLAKLKE